MAIKIIERHDPTFKISCSHCTSILEYSENDISTAHGIMNLEDYIMCPVCNRKITIERRPK